MKKILPAIIAALAVYLWQFQINSPVPGVSDESNESDRILQAAFEGRANDIQIQGEGTVIRVLPDDADGSRHQRFIIQLDSGQTLLLSHNIDLAPRIPGPSNGDRIAFNGEYEWNPKGGVIHWTHHDPNGKHPTGWIKHNGKTYR